MIDMPSWVELVSIVLPVVFGLGMVFLKTTMQRSKVIDGRSASEGKRCGVPTIAE
jgi:hypothetical protein